MPVLCKAEGLFRSSRDFLSFILRGGQDGCPLRLREARPLSHFHTASRRWQRAPCDGLFPGLEDLTVPDRYLLSLMLPRLPGMVACFLHILPDAAQALTPLGSQSTPPNPLSHVPALLTMHVVSGSLSASPHQTGGSLRAERHLADLSLPDPIMGSGHRGTSSWMETVPVNE